MTSQTIWALLGPQAWITWVPVAGLLLWWTGRRRVATPLLALFGVAVLVFGFLPTGDRMIRALEDVYALPGDTKIPSNAVIVVLGGGEKLLPSKRSRQPEYGQASERIIEGVHLALSDPRSTLILVGGVEVRGVRDIDVNANTAMRLGVAQRRIVLVGETLNTAQNASGVAARLSPADRKRPLVLVTSAHHMPRAMLCFEALDLEPIAFPVDYRTGPRKPLLKSLNWGVWDAYVQSQTALYEYAGLLYYFIAGRTRSLWPR